MATRPMISPAYVEAVRRDRILRASAEVFAEQGYEVTKVSDLVTRAKIARNTFYELFSSKEDAFRAIIDLAISQVRTRFADLHADPQVEVDADVVLAELLQFTNENPALAKCCLVWAPNGAPDLYDSLLERSAADTGIPDPLSHLVVGGVAEVLRLYVAGYRERPSLVDLRNFVDGALEIY